jgi:hypothetical protein
MWKVEIRKAGNKPAEVRGGSIPGFPLSTFTLVS